MMGLSREMFWTFCVCGGEAGEGKGVNGEGFPTTTACFTWEE